MNWCYILKHNYKHIHAHFDGCVQLGIFSLIFSSISFWLLKHDGVYNQFFITGDLGHEEKMGTAPFNAWTWSQWSQFHNVHSYHNDSDRYQLHHSTQVSYQTLWEQEPIISWKSSQVQQLGQTRENESWIRIPGTKTQLRVE